MNLTRPKPNPVELRGHTVLIIDDEPANLEMLALSLEGADLRVLVAQTGEAGFEAARQTQPDLILLDVHRRFYNLNIQLLQEADPALFEFPAEATSQLIRAIQEALINIRKHAQINIATIRLSEENKYLCISIEDQGRGFDPDAVKEKTASFGLQIMRERVESVGGSLEVEAVPGQGTRIILYYQK